MRTVIQLGGGGQRQSPGGNLVSKADTSVILEKTRNTQRPRPKLKPVTTSLHCMGGPLQWKGQFVGYTEVKGQSFHLRIVVVDARVNNLLSRSFASRMDLILKVDEFEVFGDMRCLKFEPVKIVLLDGAESYALSIARRVPIPLQQKVKEDLNCLQAAGVIEPITMPTSWCAPIVPVM